MESGLFLPHADYYANFEELFRENTHGKDYRIETDDRSAASGLLVIAPHGGGIEPGTTELARLVADRLGASFYSFLGMRPSPDENFTRLHITSTRYDEPTARALARRHRLVCSLHGCREREEVVYVGGLRPDVMRALVRGFRTAGMDAPDIGTHRFPAVNPDNICHGGYSGTGIQIELSRGIRDRLQQDDDHARVIADVIAEALASA